MIKLNRLLGLGIIVFSLWGGVRAQVIERARPAEWNDLINGGRFMDLFLPISPLGPLSTNTWGAENVIPRYVFVVGGKTRLKDIMNGPIPLWYTL